MNEPTASSATHLNFRQIEQSAENKDFVRASLQLLENWYAMEMERRLKDITAMLREELQRQVSQLESQYKQLAQARPETPAPAVRAPEDALAEEIARSEASLNQCTVQLEGLIGDENSKLVNLLRARSQELELKAYLRGLKFLSGAQC